MAGIGGIVIAIVTVLIGMPVYDKDGIHLFNLMVLVGDMMAWSVACEWISEAIKRRRDK